MAEKINWEDNLSHALETAKKQGKLVLIDFFSPL
jgi:hypothetical protein